MPSSTDPKELTTAIRGVELVSVGTWDASTGRTSISAADLRAMVDAAQDPNADAAPVKIGHDDDRFQDANGNPPSTRDGEPAYGWVSNLRVNDQPVQHEGTDGKVETIPAGNVLLGDLVGVPKKLADIMHTALRRRSVELVRHDRVGGRVYRAVLTGLALLGVQAPAVKGLADLRDLFADQLQPTPERFSVQVEGSAVPDTPTVPQPQLPVDVNGPDSQARERAAAMALNLTREQRQALGIADNATDEEIRAKLRSLGLRFAEDDTPPAGGTSVPPTPAPAGAQPPATPPPATPPPAAPPAPPAPAAANPPPPAAAPAPTPPPPVPPAPPAAPSADEVTPQRVAAAAEQFGLAVIDRNILAQLTADAGAGRTARDEQNRVRRDGIVNGAVREGKIAPAAYTQFRAHADKDEDGLVQLLAAMPAILPTQSVGHGENLSAGQQPGGQGSADQLAAETQRLAGVYAHFGLTPPVPAGSKG